MDLSVTLAAMLDAGCTREQMLAVVQAHENEKKKGDAVRRAKDAERQRRHRLSRSVTRDRRDTALLSPSILNLPSYPPKKRPPKGGPKERVPPPRKLGSRRRGDRVGANLSLACP
jgi:hypothetical protein